MSRIGKLPISIPQGVDITYSNNEVTVKGKLGTLKQEIDPEIEIKIEDVSIVVNRPSDMPQHRAKHGLYRALINNMIKGVTVGFTKELELVGVGYRAANQGQVLDLSLGFSHNILMLVPNEVKVAAVMEKGKNPIITLTSYDKQLLGMVASKIRSLRKPEPYKGKGVRFVGEVIRRKAGKSASKK
jgi:large subunit ribosomal protein L6